MSEAFSGFLPAIIVAKSKKSKLFSFLSDFLESILMFSTGTPLHLVIVTDSLSLEQINKVKYVKRQRWVVQNRVKLDFDNC